MNRRFSVEHLLWLIGAIGAIGEAIILRHTLIDCYPYKIMHSPSGELYEMIGESSFSIVIVMVIGSPHLMKFLNKYLITTFQVIVCPLIFLNIFISLVSFSLLFSLVTLKDLADKGEGYSAFSLLKLFSYDVFQLVLIGAVTGLISSRMVLTLFGALFGEKNKSI